MNATKKSKYLLRVIGEKEPLFYSDYKIATDCLLRYRKMGKVAILMQYDPTTDDYGFIE